MLRASLARSSVSPPHRAASALLGLVGALVGTVLGVHVALAQSGESVPPLVAAMCEEAWTHVTKGEFQPAMDLYAKAYNAAPTAGILFDLALTELNSHHSLDALRHFRVYLHAPGAEKAKIARVESKLLPMAMAATGHIHIEGEPLLARLYLDGKVIDESPEGVVDVDPGNHIVVARTPDSGWKAEVTVAAGESVPARLRIVWVHSGPLPFPRADAGAPIAPTGPDAGAKP